MEAQLATVQPPLTHKNVCFKGLNLVYSWLWSVYHGYKNWKITMTELSADYRLALAKEALDRLTEDYGYPVTGDPQHWPDKDAAFILEQLEAAAKIQREAANHAPVRLSNEERVAVIRRAVEIIRPNVPNETAAWNTWNNLAGDYEFRDAIVMIADYLSSDPGYDDQEVQPEELSAALAAGETSADAELLNISEFIAVKRAELAEANSLVDEDVLDAEEAAEATRRHTAFLEEARRLGIPHYHVPGTGNKGLQN
jgi:hypothetical protein